MSEFYGPTGAARRGHENRAMEVESLGPTRTITSDGKPGPWNYDCCPSKPRWLKRHRDGKQPVIECRACGLLRPVGHSFGTRGVCADLGVVCYQSWNYDCFDTPRQKARGNTAANNRGSWGDNNTRKGDWGNNQGSKKGGWRGVREGSPGRENASKPPPQQCWDNGGWGGPSELVAPVVQSGLGREGPTSNWSNNSRSCNPDGRSKSDPSKWVDFNKHEPNPPKRPWQEPEWRQPGRPF